MSKKASFGVVGMGVMGSNMALNAEDEGFTVALLDRAAEQIRTRLNKSADDLPLARILQGGTWNAGRQIAAEKRDGGGPPLKLELTGTVF